MKLSGSKRNGRHLQKGYGGAHEFQRGPDGEIIAYNGGHGSEKKTGGQHLKKRAVKENKTNPAMPRKPRKALKFLTVFSLVLVAVISVVFAYYKLAVDTAPPVNDWKRPSTTKTPASNTGSSGGEADNPTSDPTSVPAEDPTPPGRHPLTFTFLVLATDNEDANTDTIMAVTFDAKNYTVEVVNIPRDTLVNVSWNTKKVNSILNNMRYYYRNEEDSKEKALAATVEHFADILGYEVDYYFVVDLKAFIALVDAVDGVEYTVPVNMDYDDPAQNLHIHYQKGKSYHLTGQKAMEVLRFRKSNSGGGYAQGDIGRINTQQDFLKAAAQQILAKKNSISITELVSIFQKYISTSQTNLKINHLLYFAQELMKMDADNIRFSTIPANYNDGFRGDSYITIYVDEWLEMLNEKLNPFLEPITENDVSILTRGSGGKLYVTDGNYQYSGSWGTSNSSGSSGSSGGGSSGGASSGSSGGGTSSGNENPSSNEEIRTPSGDSETSAPPVTEETPDNSSPPDNEDNDVVDEGPLYSEPPPSTENPDDPGPLISGSFGD